MWGCAVDSLSCVSSIQPEDTVWHRPTGETWVVKDVQGEYLSWYGYPPGRALVADCEKVEETRGRGLDRPCSFCRRPIRDCNADGSGCIPRALLLSARAGVVEHRGGRYALTWVEGE